MEVIPRLRALINSIVLTPSAFGHRVDIEVGGRSARMIELATGQPLDDRGVIAMERVKGIEPPAKRLAAERIEGRGWAEEELWSG